MRIGVFVLAISCAAAAARAQSTAPAASGTSEAAGVAIVVGKGKCLTCHRIGNNGSRLGPDLTDAGAVRTPAQIEASLRTPDAEILPENRFYRVITKDGTNITGRLLNHDTFQVLMRDGKDRLLSFTKAELREHGFVASSPMPSYGATLSAQELQDVVAYLSSLKGVVAE